MPVGKMLVQGLAAQMNVHSVDFSNAYLSSTAVDIPL